jgi:hypothetical protein
MGGRLTLEYIKSAPMPLTAIALLDVTTKQKICFVVDNTGEVKEIKKEDKHVIPCTSEKDLIFKKTKQISSNLF